MGRELELRHSLTAAQVDALVALYANEWWTRGREREGVEAMLAASSRLYALVEPASGRLAAFARVLTDGVYTALLLDVIVAPELRGAGLGRRLMEAVLGDPELARVGTFELACQPALVPFYEKWGFAERPGGSTLMRRRGAPDPGSTPDEEA